MFTNGHQSPIIGGCIDRTLLWRSQLSDVLLHNMVVTIASDVYIMLTFVTNPEKLPFSELFAQSLYRATPVQATAQHGNLVLHSSRWYIRDNSHVMHWRFGLLFHQHRRLVCCIAAYGYTHAGR